MATKVARRHYVVAEDAADVIAVTAVGERVLTRAIEKITSARGFETKNAVAIILARVRAQHPELHWRVVDNNELRALLGLKPRKQHRTHNTALTHAEHIHNALEKTEDEGETP